MASSSVIVNRTATTGLLPPRGLEPLLEGEQHVHNEPSSASTPRPHRAVLATWRNALLLAIALCACLLLVGIPIGLAITIYGAGSLAAMVAPLLSIIGATAVTAAWIAFPAVRSAHTGQVTCLSVAYAWHSMAWLLFWWSAYASWPALARCNTFKIAMAGWVCTFLWCFPIGLDWLLLMRGDLRSAGGARVRCRWRATSRGSWPPDSRCPSCARTTASHRSSTRRSAPMTRRLARMRSPPFQACTYASPSLCSQPGGPT